jgi:ribosomal protein S18 acetylase RimI-like enzyme
MKIRPFHPEDAATLTALSARCARGENEFVLNPFWETEQELFGEFDRFGIDPGEHLLVADGGEVLGFAGYLRQPGASAAALMCPIVARGDRGRGLGGELLRAAQALGSEKLGIQLVTAAIGTRNRFGYSLLTSHGFRPVRQHFLMRGNEKPADSPQPVDDLELCEAELDHADAILAIYAACGFEQRSPQQMRSILVDGRHAHAVARREGRIVAFTELETHWPERVWVAYVGVDPGQRDRGVGSTLVAWALRRRFEAGARAALLMLSPANRTALRAYEKVGMRRFRLVDVLEKKL